MKLKNAKSFYYETQTTVFRYHLTYDYHSGRKNRYTVVIPTEFDPIVIGRELDLKSARELITTLEKRFSGTVWLGDRRSALKLLKKHYSEIKDAIDS